MSIVKKQDQAAPAPGKASGTRFIETLANEHNYWMSLTDAARVTRTSEAMARRWVSSGRLPVKQEPVGINQRTRLVRASDVAQIRPIVDPTAAITDQIHKLDLLSIPRQQLQIAEAQGRLLELVQSVQLLVKQLAEETRAALEQEATHLKQQVQTWNQRLSSQHQTVQQVLQFHQQQHEALAQHVDNQGQEIQQYSGQLSAQATHQQQELERIHISLTAQLEAVQQQVERLDQDHRAREDQLRHDYIILLQKQEIQFHHVLQGIEETLTRYDAECSQLQQQVSSLERSREGYQHALSAQLEQHIQKIRSTLEQQRSAIVGEKKALHERVAPLERRLEQICSQIEAVQSDEQERAKAQDQQMQTFAAQLQDEIHARQALQAHFDAQAK